MRLKLLDYDRINPFGEIIGRPNRLAWPVNVYRLTLPKASGDGNELNPFERVILKLLESAGRMDERALHEESRIPLDLVKGIVLRLRDKGFIDENNKPIDRSDSEGKAHEKKAPVFVTALLFRELVNGKILPFLHLLSDNNPLRKREEENYIKLLPANPSHNNALPVPKDVIIALRSMKRRSASFGKGDQLPAVQQITIIPKPERHYLECPIAIQKSDGEYRIADPFGNGFSLVLEAAFSQLLEQDPKMEDWFLEWKESLKNPRRSTTDHPGEWPKEPFDTDSNEQRYPKLVESLRRRYVRSDGNVDWAAVPRPILKIHASIEWALFYACCQRPFEDAIAELRLAAQLEHSALLGRAALSFGLEPPQFGFKAVPEGKIIDFKEGQAEFGTVLAIALLQAERDETHPLRRIAILHHDFISRLLEIKKQRDEKGHGKGGAHSPNVELPYETFMCEIVHALVPDIQFADSPAIRANSDARADSILDARTSIQRDFGLKAFNCLGANLQDRLIHAESFWLASKDGDDALMFVCDLYAVLQARFRQILLGSLPPEIPDSEFISFAQKKAQDYNLGKLPERLRTVKPLAIRQTLQGSDATLGACVVAFLIMAEEDALYGIANLQPTVIEEISRIITLRGHGNEPLPMQKSDVAKIRKSAYTIIKTLQEI